MDIAITTFVVQVIFIVTALLALLNLLKKLDEIPILRFFQIREEHIKHLFNLLILEVIVGLTPVLITTISHNFLEYSYNDTHNITVNKTNIEYRRPFKYPPSVKITSKHNYSDALSVSLIENSQNGFTVEADDIKRHFEINYTVTGVPKY